MIKKVFKKIVLLGITAFCYFPFQSFAQTTINYTADSTMSDAMVANGGVENSNFGSQNQMNVYHQLNQQIPMAFRTYIQYDLSAIPNGAIITEAKLKLMTLSVNNAINHPIYIERVGSTSWYEDTITWNNQPSIITADQLSFTHAQTSSTGLHEFVVTDHVQKMITNPNSNNGWRIRLQSESGSADFGINYYASESSNSAKRPVLTITYILPLEMTTSVDHCTAGNSDGTMSVMVSGGNSYALANMYFYKTVRDTTQLGKATLTNAKVTNNLLYNTGTGEVTADNLEPGVYILRILDADYYTNSDLRFAYYKHIMVGREGEMTSGILLPNYQYQENVTIEFDKPTNSNPLDRANTNYHSQTTSIPLRISDAPNNYEKAALIKYELDFDDQLEFTVAELKIKAWSSFFRHNNSSNAVDYTLITEDWHESDVTWNTRPATDTNYRVNVPTTTYIGYDPVHNLDTVDILTMVEYWQDNPSDNYGFEMALETYGATQYASRDYKSANTNANYVYFEWSVIEAVSATYDDDTQLGSVVVNAPEGSPLPYKYLISYNPLPELSTIWTAIKDSIPVDSATFYAGDVQSTTFTFEALDAERYYIGVYDNNGVKILDGKANVTPELTLLDNANIDLTDGTLKRGQSQGNGSAILDGMLQPNQSGGFEFEVTAIGGNMVIGFNDQSESKPLTTADFEYSFELFTDNTFNVLKSDSVLFTDTVEVGDIFRLTKQNNQIVYNLNEFELHREAILIDERVSLNGGVLVRTPTIEISHAVKLEHYKPSIRPLTTIPFQMECGDQLGSVRAAYTAPEFFGGTGSYSITNIITEIIEATGPIADVLVGGVDLPVGEYRIDYSYTVGGITYTFTHFFTIGYPIFWNVLNLDFAEIDGTVNTITAPSLLNSGLAISQNNLPHSDGGWVSYNVSLYKYYVPYGDDPMMPLPTKASIKFVDQFINTEVEVMVVNYGGGIISNYIWVVGDEGNMFTTYKEGPIKIRRIDIAPSDDIWDYEVSFNENPIPFSTVDESDPSGDENRVFHVFAKGNNVSIYNSYASFCGFLTIRSYADLTKKLDGGYYLAENGIVKFIYNEEYNDQDDELTYTIYDATRNIAASDVTLAQTVVYGDNRYDLDFSTFTGDIVLENGVYVLEVKNEKNEKWYLRFKIIKN
ncbi:MAG: DNRLRE domain-containing protein [Crocinitomix sp.]|nr:DNRLRE domain-containing protein [Crocinitomix sp.]